MTRTASARSSLAPSRAWALALVVAAMASTGAACPQAIRGYQVGTMPLPRTLPAQPTIDHGRSKSSSSPTKFVAWDPL